MKNLRLIIVLAFLSLCPAAAAQEYFPSGVFDKDSKPSDFTVQWYSAQLKCLEEPSLWEWSKTQKSEVYRFLWLRTFHPQISVRLNVNADGTATATIKKCTVPHHRGDTGKLVLAKTRHQTKQQMEYFLNRLAELQFWDMPTLEKTDMIGVDGAEWLMEGVKDGKYLVLDRWAPKDGTVHVLGLYLLIDVAKFKLLYQDVY